MPPHTTHALQPLDVSVFKSLKDTFSKAARAMSFAKHFFVISKREFSRVLKSPLDKSFSIPNIKAGFRNVVFTLLILMQLLLLKWFLHNCITLILMQELP